MGTGLVSFRVLGTRTIPGSSPPLFNGADMELELADGSKRAFGVRTGALYQLGAPTRDEGWDDGYTPILTDLDLRTVTFWDFSEILWLGPEPQPCIVWSNAEGFNEKGLETILTVGDLNAVVSGRDHRGLPLVDDVRHATV